jgi:hypothetical protein
MLERALRVPHSDIALGPTARELVRDICACCARWSIFLQAAARYRRASQYPGGSSLTDFSALSDAELADRIAIIRDNLRQITEQAAVQSGAADEERNADRIWRQNDELDELLKEQTRRARK